MGWQGSRLSVKTRTGEDISVECSNHLWQCDHTLVDVLLVDKDGGVIGRPWLTQWQFQRKLVGDHHQLHLHVDGHCHRCFMTFAQMAEYQKPY